MRQILVVGVDATVETLGTPRDVVDPADGERRQDDQVGRSVEYEREHPSDDVDQILQLAEEHPVDHQRDEVQQQHRYDHDPEEDVDRETPWQSLEEKLLEGRVLHKD